MGSGPIIIKRPNRTTTSAGTKTAKPVKVASSKSKSSSKKA